MNDDVRSATTPAAGAGGVLWAMATAFAVLFAPTPPDLREVTRACVEAVFSILAAWIGGWFVAPAICVHLHIGEIETVSLIGLGVGSCSGAPCRSSTSASSRCCRPSSSQEPRHDERASERRRLGHDAHRGLPDDPSLAGARLLWLGAPAMV